MKKNSRTKVRTLSERSRKFDTHAENHNMAVKFSTLQITNNKKSRTFRHDSVVLEGLEPSLAEPESDVLPLHHKTSFLGSSFPLISSQRASLFRSALLPDCECKVSAFLRSDQIFRVLFFEVFSNRLFYSIRGSAIMPKIIIIPTESASDPAGMDYMAVCI